MAGEPVNIVPMDGEPVCVVDDFGVPCVSAENGRLVTIEANGVPIVLDGYWSDEISDDDDWSDNSSTGGASSSDDGSLTLTNTIGAASVTQSISFDDGSEYKLSFVVVGGDCKVNLSGSYELGSFSSGFHSVTFTASSSYDRICFINSILATVAIITLTSLKKVL